MAATITYTDIQFGFPPADPNVFSPYSAYYNLTLDKSQPWVRAEIIVDENKVYTIHHHKASDDDEAHTIKMTPIHPYPTFGIYLDTTLVYGKMYVYEATLRIYHTGDFTSQDVESWSTKTQMTYRD
jgi:hypothetical protein